MKKFSFPLERVLGTRKIKEKLKQREMAAAIRLEEAENERLQKMEEKKQTALAILKKTQEKEFNPGVLALLHTTLDGQRWRCQKQQERVKIVRVKLDQSRKSLLQARRSTKVIEKLRERRHEEYVQKVEKSEQKAIDEVAVIKYATMNSKY
ncbi:MAG: flagellar export protein FliJ [Calditrichaeota bacterium]|nr:flagellar export protein FliJ [Calditrichota bacterium]